MADKLDPHHKADPQQTEAGPDTSGAGEAPERGEEGAPTAAPESGGEAAAGPSPKPVPEPEVAPPPLEESVPPRSGVRAVARYVRMSPRKLRLVADAIRGRRVVEARALLRFARKRAAGPLAKVLESAVANAENNFDLDAEDLVVARLTVDEGPTMKSWIPRARGRASRIHKRTSHITVELRESEVER